MVDCMFAKSVNFDYTREKQEKTREKEERFVLAHNFRDFGP